MRALDGTGLANEMAVSERLLVVDDSDAVRKAYECHFSKSGFEVKSAASLKEATEELAACSYSAVIVDVSLSSAVGSEGLAIAAYLRQLEGGSPVVVLTAYGEPQRATAAASLGVDAFLHKPVSLEWLEGFLRSRLHRGPGHPGREDSEPEAAAV